MSGFWTINQETSTHMEFELTGTGVSIAMANAIRRVALADIPTVAISQEDVHISINSSPLHNEFISHRISILPVRQDLVDPTTLQFFIGNRDDPKNPFLNPDDGVYEITTKDVQVLNNQGQRVDPASVFTDVFLISKLNIGQSLQASWRLRRGTAAEHARWAPVSTIAYRYKTFTDMEKQIPYDALSIEQEVNYPRNKEDDPVAFLFTMDTAGILPPKEVILRSLHIIRDKVETFQRELGTPDSKLLTQKWDNRKQMLEIHYRGETHTLGNLLATTGLSLLTEDDFIGYRIIHPLQNEILIRIRIDASDTKEECVSAMNRTCEVIIATLQQMETEWTGSSVKETPAPYSSQKDKSVASMLEPSVSESITTSEKPKRTKGKISVKKTI